LAPSSSLTRTTGIEIYSPWNLIGKKGDWCFTMAIIRHYDIVNVFESFIIDYNNQSCSDYLCVICFRDKTALTPLDNNYRSVIPFFIVKWRCEWFAGVCWACKMSWPEDDISVWVKAKSCSRSIEPYKKTWLSYNLKEGTMCLEFLF
jgi:hypothetical protein